MINDNSNESNARKWLTRWDQRKCRSEVVFRTGRGQAQVPVRDGVMGGGKGWGSI